MKKIFSLLALAVVGLTLASCSNDYDYTEKENNIQILATDGDVIPATGGTINYKVTGYIVTAIPADTWFTAEIQDSLIVVTAEPNTSRESRSSHVTLRDYNSDTQILSVVQYGTVLSLSESTFDIKGAQADLTVTAQSTDGADVTVESQADWITATYNAETGEINIHVDANTVVEPREGEVWVTCQGITEKITIKQGGIVLDVANTEWYLKSVGATNVTIPVTRSIEVQAESDADWLTATFNENTSRLTLSAAASDVLVRTAKVTLTSGTLTKELNVTQYGLLGDYFLFYTNPTDNNSYYMSAVLDDKALATSVFAIPVKSDAAAGNTTEGLLTLGPSGSSLGTYGPYYMGLIFLNMVEGMWTYHVADGGLAVTVSGDVVFEEDEDDGSISQYVDFSGTFQWDEEEPVYDIDTWWIGAYSSEEMSSANYLGTLLRMGEPYLGKVPDAAAAPARVPMRNGLAVKARNGKWAYPVPEKSYTTPVFTSLKTRK